jgi:hypothetical protein
VLVLVLVLVPAWLSATSAVEMIELLCASREPRALAPHSATGRFAR